MKDVLELGYQSRILAVTYNNPEYHVIDLIYKQSTLLGPGFSDLAYSITPFPAYDYERFPFVLCKESDCIAILNPTPLNQMARILLVPSGTQVDKIRNEDNVIFDKNDPKVFYTAKGSFYLAKYEINPALYDSLKMINA